MLLGKARQHQATSHVWYIRSWADFGSKENSPGHLPLLELEVADALSSGAADFLNVPVVRHCIVERGHSVQLSVKWHVGQCHPED